MSAAPPCSLYGGCAAPDVCTRAGLCVVGRLRPAPPTGAAPVTADEIEAVVRDVEARPFTVVRGPLRMEHVGGEGHAVRYRLLAPVRYDVPASHGLPPALSGFTVPYGFTFDRATMPRGARVLGSIGGLDRDHLDGAACAHDYALSRRRALGVSRADCDRLFLAVALAEPHLPDWLARAAYVAVRANTLYEDHGRRYVSALRRLAPGVGAP